jgi:signal transduction histidine kinase
VSSSAVPSSAAPLSTAASSTSRKALPQGLRKLLDRTRSSADEHEQRFEDPDGGECWLLARCAAVPSGDEAARWPRPALGESARTEESTRSADSIFILRDISESKRLVRDRERLRREQALAEMSAILAHEIRNPLGSLELFAGLLAKAGLSAECQRWVEHVQAGLRTLAATVNNVLHFHSLPAPERVPTDIGRLLEWAGGFLVPMARRARVELRLRNHLNGAWFPADRHRLEQVLLNLVLNAIRAMPGGGWVEVYGAPSSLQTNRSLVVRVSDSGPGIRQEQANKLFEPGFSTHSGSPGLGLAVCRKIVEQHGGRLTATNCAGVGACFTMTLPLGNEIGDEIGNATRNKISFPETLRDQRPIEMQVPKIPIPKISRAGEISQGDVR